MRSGLIGGLACVAALSVVLTLAACGSSDDSNSSSTASISKSEFLKKGNAACQQGNQQINAAGKQVFGTNGNHKNPTQAEQTKFATDTLIPVVQKEIDQIKTLGAPKGDEAQVKAVVDAAQAALDKGKANPTALIQSDSDPFAKANKLANDYGLTVCGG
jgi:uncharacterized protein (UPF0333 family)